MISKLNYFRRVLVSDLTKGLKINMDQPKISLKSNILVAPLDWGLGHTTRCIPVIRSLLKQGAGVILAGEGKAQILLEKEFPDLPFIGLKGYNVNYSDNKWSLPFVLASQVPKILSAIQYENKWLQEQAQIHNIDGIISDNRYGLYHSNIPSVFITHQLLIKTGLGSLADLLMQEQNYSYIDRFTECWVPDNLNEPNLAGELSHPKHLPRNSLKYVGPLSRFDSPQNESAKHVLILLSGPEPQRTKLEQIFLEQLQKHEGPVVMVRGLPGDNTSIDVPANVSVFDHLPAESLQEKFKDASFVIGRCGYSTLMDLTYLKKKSILIPTPGQTEQEYLARHLQKSNFAFCVEQEKFKLKNVLELASRFNYKFPEFVIEDQLDHAVSEFLSAVAAKKKQLTEDAEATEKSSMN